MAKHPAIFYVSVLAYVVATFAGDSDTCLDGPSTWYEGNRNYTTSGTPCQRWDVKTPHDPKHIPSDGGHHNFCRNPDGDLKGTWCYTMNKTKRWEYCDIPKCHDDSLVVWTNHDALHGGAHILSVQADPEIVKNMTDQSGSFNVKVLVSSNKSRTEYWAVAADYNDNLLFYTDYMSEYIGILYLQLNASVKRYEGMAHGIENMAYDWITGNLYWTDSEFQWIMATDPSFRFYTPVYRTNGNPPYAIALHAKQRKLFFSVYKTYGSKIVTTDLAGHNATTLFQFPKVFDVTGLTIDYTDNRLYWTDFTGFGGMVMSSKLDGTNKTRHHYKGGAIFWGVTAYLDYLYVTDVHARYTSQAKKYFSVWIINKRLGSVFRYTLEGKPRGISVLSKNEERSFDNVSSEGSCQASKLCDHICLPRVGAKRECACSLGYTKVGDTTCVTNTIQDNFLLIADAGQGKVFQMNLFQSEGEKTNYSIVPLRNSKQITTVAVDLISRALLWSDKRVTHIKKALLDGSRTFNLVNGKHGNSIVVDPRDGNVYFSDEDTQTIYIMTSSGTYIKPLRAPTKDQLNSTAIKMLALDSKNSFLYWTDTRGVQGKGQVWRMRTDGYNPEIVFDKLQWPHAITIDYARNSLFVSEAKEIMIYEKSLEKLQIINSTSHASAENQYDLAGHIPRLTFYIIDIKVHNNILYFIDGKANRVEKFNLTSGPASVSELGPREFYKPSSLALFSNTYHKQYIANIPNPCSQRTFKCQQICIAISPKTSECQCEEGLLRSGSRCYGTKKPKNPPSAGGTCPQDIEVQFRPCMKYVPFQWTSPVWTDDKTAVEDLIISEPDYPNPAKLFAGEHVFKFTATDKDKNTAACSFIVTVKPRSTCPERPTLPSNLTTAKEPCDNNWGAEYAVRCKAPMQLMVSEELQSFSTNVTNVCHANGSWLINDWSSFKCRPASEITITTPKPPPTETTIKSENRNKDKGSRKREGKPAKSGLKPGPIAAIAILAVLIVIFIVAVVVFSIRSRPIWKVTRFQFPIPWKRKSEDAETIQPSENPYSVMT